jgi:hypothetical protein
MEFLINKPKNYNEDINIQFYQSVWSQNSKYEEFKNFILDLVNNKESKTFYKFSDGEYYWLTNNQIGSVQSGKRDSNTTKRDLRPFQEGVLKCDYLMCQLLNRHVEWFRSYFNRDFDFPVDYVYSLVSDKWFTRTFNGKIGIIGADNKLDLIKSLCEKEEYLSYLEFDGFTDYIKVPQKYLCDNIDSVELEIAESLRNSSSDIFLIGIGHAQQALLHRLKKYKNAVYIVIGSGVDAYAGIQDNTRPYMGEWINYQLKNFDYSKVDVWSPYDNKKFI